MKITRIKINKALRKLNRASLASEEEFRRLTLAMKKIQPVLNKKTQWKQSPLDQLRNK